MDLEHELFTGLVGDDEDVGFLADADLVADRVDGRVLLMGVQRQVVEAAVGEAVAVIFCTMEVSRLLGRYSFM